MMKKPASHPSIRVAVVDAMPKDYGDLLAAADTPGVSIHFMVSGNDAIRFARRWQAGLWVINSRLPDMSGFDLAEILRSMRPSALVFIIGDEYCLDDEVQTLTLGLAKYTCKPLEPAWILPYRDESCIPMLAFQQSPPALRVVSAAELDLPPVISMEESLASDDEDSEQVILPFDPDARRRPAA